jgi:ferredoxin-NADP reductase
LMFNGYEIWKSDSQKCASYRISTPGGAMCGRCMKTCPWNLEGLFAEAPFRWAAMNVPQMAPVLAKMDDMAGHGELNSVKKWWWDLELTEAGGYRPTAHPINARSLQKDLDLKYEDQTLAVYPAPLAPHPFPYPAPMDREAGIEAYQAMITAEVYQEKSATGARDHLHLYQNDHEAPVIQMSVAEVEDWPGAVKKYRLVAVDGADLPQWTAGAHLDIVVAPEFLRQYSMCGDPADRSCYEIAVLQEPEGRGGSQLMHRIFEPGRRVFVSKPINHFELEPSAKLSLLFGGGIGVTPMLAFAHELHRKGGRFRLMYSASQKSKAAFDGAFDGLAWADRVSRHYSDQGTRLDIARDVPAYDAGTHIYVCGPDAYMSAILDHARSIGYPEAALHAEFFTVPELPEWENHPFEIERANGQKIPVTATQSASDALIAAGIPVDVKCADGLCGVCKCTVLSGEVEHRDFVLSAAQRETTVILCQSRAAEAGGMLKLDI